VISPSGDVSTLCGCARKSGHQDGKGSNALFNTPTGIAIDNSTGTLFVTDCNNHCIRVVSRNGEVSTLCGSVGQQGFADGKGSQAKFNYPRGIVFVEGVLFVADYYNHCIRKVTLNGEVSTVCGIPEKKGCVDGTAHTATFNCPFGITHDNKGNLFVSEWNNHTIRKITGLISLLPSPLEQDLLGLLDNKNLSDIVIKVQDSSYFLHKCILEARCPSLLTQPNNTLSLHIPHNDFTQFLQFIYGNKFNSNKQPIQTLINILV
jgi:hypothetical protein